MKPRNYWTRHFPDVPGLPNTIVRQLNQSAGELSVREQTDLRVFLAQEPTLILIKSGRLRVHLDSGAGPRIRYYHATSEFAETMTNACQIAGGDACRKVIAETDVQAVTVSLADFSQLMTASPDFRAFMHRLCSQRIENLLRHATEGRCKQEQKHGTDTVTQPI